MSHSNPTASTDRSPPDIHQDYVNEDIEVGGRRLNTVSSDSVTLDHPGPPEDDTAITKDLYFLPIPNRLRYNPNSPPKFGLFLNVLFGLASTFGEFSKLRLPGRRRSVRSAAHSINR
ncbi:hypothetical protein PHLCEN_2v7153 [Hermanssonia centrifuga]|uniref:Uncharacterized protein n=1 Tax=Hermanssonia centrifuga TaxID=98765 RepID=A0A2R6NXF4_9APHY|nr:hypothetical protein PHLCEN_2v7153 [Hermanssonia centrifuga]